MAGEPFDGPAEFVQLFSVEEANALLPSLEPRLVELKQAKEALDEARVALDGMAPAMRGNGHGAAATEYERRITELIMILSLGIRQINALGVEIKDLNLGLIDFPHRRGDRIVYLCWRLGEGLLAYWHELDAGYGGRQPLENENQ